MWYQHRESGVTIDAERQENGHYLVPSPEAGLPGSLIPQEDFEAAYDVLEDGTGDEAGGKKRRGRHS